MSNFFSSGIFLFVSNLQSCIDAALVGVNLVVKTIVPTIFPFSVICNLLISYDGVSLYSKSLGPLFCKPLKLSKSSLSDEERNQVDLLFNTVNDIERVSDHAENISELSSIVIEKDLSFSENAIEEMKNIYSKSQENFKKALKCLEENDKNMINIIYKLEDEVDALDKLYRKLHIERLNNGKCTIDSGVVFLDLLTNLERVSDHSCNIANRVESN